MKISIITVVYNGAKYIEQAMQSVLKQRLPDGCELEYIVIDGGSTDGTVEIIEKYRSKLGYFVSRPDTGIYNAMNKGIKHASGDVIGILNADDFYADEYVLQDVIKEFAQNTKLEAVYANLEYVHADDIEKVVRYWKSRPYKKGLFKMGWHPAHPTLFVRRQVYERCGIFDENFKIAADYEFMLRIFEKCSVKSEFLDRVLVKMRVGGESNASVKNIFKANIESHLSWQKNGFGVLVSGFAVVCKLLSKLPQLVRRA